MHLDHRFVAAFAAALFVLFAFEGVALAEGRRGGKRRSGSAHKEVTRTGPGGQSRTWSQDTRRQREPDRARRETRRTDPRGDTRTREDVVQRTDDGYTRDTTLTDRRGRTSTREATVSRDPEAGTRTKEVLWTGPEGKTGSRVTESARTEDGRMSTTTVIRPDGETVTYEKSVTRSSATAEDDE